MPQTPVAETLGRGLQNRRVIGKDLDGKTKRIEGSAERQLHIAEERILWPSRTPIVRCLRGRLKVEIAVHRVASSFSVRR